MMSDINAAIRRLQHDSGNLPFTGYLTNVRVEEPPCARGEIWRHVAAEESGKFADGHLVETSGIAQIEIRRQSIWVVTENNSRYGILSFAPVGWLYFSEMLQLNARLEPNTEVPSFRMDLTSDDLPPPKLAVRRARSSDDSGDRGSAGRKRKPGYPEIDPRAYQSRLDATEALIDALKQNGVRGFQDES
jgi:hypothetical protein